MKNKTITLLATFAVLAGLLACPVAYIQSKASVVCTVDEKDRTRGADGNSDVRIYTEDCGVLSLQDSVIALSFDSADKYNAIEPGERYRFTTYGWRVPFLSLFPNITSVEVVGR